MRCADWMRERARTDGAGSDNMCGHRRGGLPQPREGLPLTIFFAQTLTPTAVESVRVFQVPARVLGALCVQRIAVLGSLISRENWAGG